MSYIGKNPKWNTSTHTPQSADPVNPVEGMVFYSDGTSRSEGFWQYKDGNFQVLGSGGSGINYIENPDAEGGTNGHVLYDDGSEIPVDGSGGSPTITLTASSVDPLRGVKSFLLAKPASDAQGQGDAIDFTIDPADQASIIRISLDYTVSADYNDGDVGIFVYDVTNSNIIRLSKEDLDATSLNGKLVTEFQAAPDSVSYRLLIHVKSTNASAYDLKYDNIEVGPRSITRGAVVIDNGEFSGDILGVESGTPPTLGSGTTTRYSWSRVGQYAEVEIFIDQSSAGSSGSGSYAFDISEIGAIDESILEPSDVSNGVPYVGSGVVFSGSFYNAVCTYDNGSGKIVVTLDEQGASLKGIWGSSFAPFGNVNVKASLKLRVPIQGWSSNMTVSEDFGGRVLSAGFDSADANSYTSSLSQITWNTVDHDTAGMVSGDTIVIPESGYYDCKAQLYMQTSTTPGAIDNYQIAIRSDGAVFARALMRWQGNSNARHASTETVTYLEKGAVIDVAASTSIGTGSISSLGGTSLFTVTKIQSPQTLAGGEVIAMRANKTDGQSITANTIVSVDFNSLEIDTHGALSSDGFTYTIPQSGIYHVDMHMTFNDGVSRAASSVQRVIVQKNGSNTLVKNVPKVATDTFQHSMGVSGIVQCNKGDTITFAAQSNGSSTSVETASASATNTISIHKIN